MQTHRFIEYHDTFGIIQVGSLWVLKYYVFETNIFEVLVPRWNLKLVSLGRGQGETEKDAWHSRFVGGRFIQQKNSYEECLMLLQD